MDAGRRIKALVDYLKSLPDNVLSDEAKEDLQAWLDFICRGWDSTELMRWYPAFSSVTGHYLSALQERIDQQKLVKDKAAAIARKSLASTKTKVTVDQAKAEVQADPVYIKACEDLIKTERLYNFISYVRESLNPDVVQAFGHNQRLEIRQDSV